MIRINLLPVKTSRKQEAGRQQLVVLAVALVVTGVGNFYAWQRFSGEEDRLKDQVARTQKQIAELDKVIAEVKDINKKEQELHTKLDALNTLKSGRAGPVKILDAFQTAIPKKVWVGSVGETGGAMKVSGTALSQDDLAEFMSSLQNVVDTPEGIGRLVAGDANSKESRVELSTGQIKLFKVDKVQPFFTNVQLVKDAESSQGDVKTVNFDLTLSANYAA